MKAEGHASCFYKRKGAEVRTSGRLYAKRRKSERRELRESGLKFVVDPRAASRETALRKHEEAVLRQRSLREHANAERRRHVAALKRQSREPAMRKIIDSFRLPGGGWADAEDPLACDHWLEASWELATEWRALSTWRRYGGSWLRARAWLREQCERSGKPFHMQTFRKYPRMFGALAMWAHASSAAQTAVESVVLATRMAMRFNNFEVADDLITRIARESARRSRGLMVRKKAGFTIEMVRAVNARWGALEAAVGKRMIALAIVVGFLGLLRFSDLRVICVSGILWLKEGVVITLPSRKNAQSRPSLVFIADTGARDGAVARMRMMVTRITGKIPPLEGFLQDPRFLFRRVDALSGHTQWHKQARALPRRGDHTHPGERAADPPQV